MQLPHMFTRPVSSTRASKITRLIRFSTMLAGCCRFICYGVGQTAPVFRYGLGFALHALIAQLPAAAEKGVQWQHWQPWLRPGAGAVVTSGNIHAVSESDGGISINRISDGMTLLTLAADALVVV